MSLSSSEPFVALANEIKNRSNNKPVALITTSGSWGDAVVLSAAKKFLNHFSIDYMHWHIPNFRGNNHDLACTAADQCNVMLSLANGRFLYKENTIAELTNLFSSSIIAPHTHTEYAASMKFSENTLFFVRDKEVSVKWRPDAFFCHDLAFFHNIKNTDGNRVGVFFRKDSEGLAKHSFLSRYIANVDDFKSYSVDSPEDLVLSKLQGYRVIFTDRLHVSILSSVMGIETYLIDSVNEKASSVYNASMRDNYVKTHLVDDTKEMFDLLREYV